MLSPQDYSVRAAFEILLKTDAVYDRMIGPSGKRPDEYKAFEILWKAGETGKDYALKLVRAGAPAAQVYGAILLIELDKGAAEREFPRLEEETTIVEIHSGCDIEPKTIRDIVRQLKLGGFVIFTPKGKWSPGMIDHTFQEMGIRCKVFYIPPAIRPVKR
jgi:hypothetical protein